MQTKYKKTILHNKILLYFYSILRICVFGLIYNTFDNIIYKIQIYTGITLSSTLQYKVDWTTLYSELTLYTLFFFILTNHILSIIYSKQLFNIHIFKALLFKYSISTLIFLMGLFSIREDKKIFNYIIAGITIFILILFNTYFKYLYKYIMRTQHLRIAIKKIYEENKKKRFIYIYKNTNGLYTLLNIILIGTPYFITYINNHLNTSQTE